MSHTRLQSNNKGEHRQGQQTYFYISYHNDLLRVHENHKPEQSCSAEWIPKKALGI